MSVLFGTLFDKRILGCSGPKSVLFSGETADAF